MRSHRFIGAVFSYFSHRATRSISWAADRQASEFVRRREIIDDDGKRFCIFALFDGKIEWSFLLLVSFIPCNDLKTWNSFGSSFSVVFCHSKTISRSHVSFPSLFLSFVFFYSFFRAFCCLQFARSLVRRRCRRFLSFQLSSQTLFAVLGCRMHLAWCHRCHSKSHIDFDQFAGCVCNLCSFQRATSFAVVSLLLHSSPKSNWNYSSMKFLWIECESSSPNQFVNEFSLFLVTFDIFFVAVIARRAIQLSKFTFTFSTFRSEFNKFFSPFNLPCWRRMKKKIRKKSVNREILSPRGQWPPISSSRGLQKKQEIETEKCFYANWKRVRTQTFFAYFKIAFLIGCAVCSPSNIIVCVKKTRHAVRRKNKIVKTISFAQTYEVRRKLTKEQQKNMNKIFFFRFFRLLEMTWTRSDGGRFEWIRKSSEMNTWESRGAKKRRRREKNYGMFVVAVDTHCLRVSLLSASKWMFVALRLCALVVHCEQVFVYRSWGRQCKRQQQNSCLTRKQFSVLLMVLFTHWVRYSLFVCAWNHRE